MTRRPIDTPTDLWAESYAGKIERLNRAWLRLYCAAMPKDARRPMYWTAGWGPIGMMIAVMAGGEYRLLSVLLSKWRRRPDSNR